VLVVGDRGLGRHPAQDAYSLIHQDGPGNTSIAKDISVLPLNREQL
jgi:hypothetical protein